MNMPTPSIGTRRLLSSRWVTFIFALLLASPLMYWTADRSDPIEVRGLALWPEEVAAGDKLFRVISVVRHKACQTNVDVIVTDGARVRWFIVEDEVLSPGPLGILDEYKAPLIIPRDAAPGDASLQLVATRRCNPTHQLWPVVTAYGPLQFKILPRTKT